MTNHHNKEAQAQMFARGLRYIATRPSTPMQPTSHDCIMALWKKTGL